MRGGAVVAQQAHNLEVGGDAPHGETAIQEPFSIVAWLVFHAVALWAAASYWWRFKRICKWHQPAPIRMGGNPWARKVTHGMCLECLAREKAEIASHSAATTADRKQQPAINNYV